MARVLNRLSDVAVRAKKRPGYSADGGNLYLRVATGGSKGWIFRFSMAGRTRDVGLGAYPTVSLVKAREEAERMSAASLAIHERIGKGGKLILFGNGGSATDANDWAIDCVSPPPGYRTIPAISLSMEPAIVTAVANDVGVETVFLRQMIAHARPEDVAIGISTSGGSRNIIMALEEARKRGLLTVALLGYDGGEILRRGLADFPLVVRSDYIPRIQEVQASTYHVIREMLEVLACA
jgi:D-sedoheptulose 7-phosphate isomerase